MSQRAKWAAVGALVLGLGAFFVAKCDTRVPPQMAGQSRSLSVPLDSDTLERLGEILSKIDTLVPSESPHEHAGRLRAEAGQAVSSGDLNTARERLAAALEIRRRLAGLYPGDQEDRIAWAEAEYQMAWVEARLRNDEAAKTYLSRGLAVTRHSVPGRTQRRLACLLHDLGATIAAEPGADHHEAEARRWMAELEAHGEVAGHPMLEDLRARFATP